MNPISEVVADPKQLSLLPARLALGSTMLYHGSSKLKPEAAREAGQMFESLGIRPGKPWAVATGLAEVLAGVCSILGIGTRVGAAAVLVTQGMAVAKVHAPKGFDSQKGGFEFNLALMAIAAGLLLAGPGLFSAHEAAERMVQRRRRLWLRPRKRQKVLRAIRLLK